MSICLTQTHFEPRKAGGAAVIPAIDNHLVDAGRTAQVHHPPWCGVPGVLGVNNDHGSVAACAEAGACRAIHSARRDTSRLGGRLCRRPSQGDVQDARCVDRRGWRRGDSSRARDDDLTEIQQPLFFPDDKYKAARGSIASHR
jgi:hypothetical protein